MRTPYRGGLPKTSKGRTILLAISIIATGSMLLTACSTSTTPSPVSTASGDRIQQGWSDAAPPAIPASSMPAPTNRVQKSEGGSVTIVVTWPAQQPSGDSLRLAVAMDTHSIELDRYDLTELATLRDNSGRQVAPTAWDGPAGGGHHRSGALVFPSTANGKSLVDSDTKYIELVIRDMANVKERVLRWNLEP